MNQLNIFGLQMTEKFGFFFFPFHPSWASSDDVWIKMLNKELKYVHDKSYLQRHPKLQPKMRAILLDWLLEVSTLQSSGLCHHILGESVGFLCCCLCAGE